MWVREMCVTEERMRMVALRKAEGRKWVTEGEWGWRMKEECD